ncbi:hypothetical protein IT774_02800 [Salinimonas marina]|uniref:Uncharacterized protein n=1 Tax=Salinimonas marina TaxID=2785918 RepID=A0A7S9DYA0_9ALTE|nr:hypothetical protein [Salinimonas marina]QPG06164.1 hypothetical protein IT774_02800 [Salinimonas marina]
MKTKISQLPTLSRLLLLIVSLWAPLSQATVVYSESIDGEFDAIGSTNIALIEGLNEIQGIINQTPPADTDRLTFTQAENMTIDSIRLVFAGIWDDANIGQQMNAALFNNQANLFDDNFGTITSGASIEAAMFDSFGPETGALVTDVAGAIWDFQLSAGLYGPHSHGPCLLLPRLTSQNHLQRLPRLPVSYCG